MECEGSSVKWRFQPIPSAIIEVELNSIQNSEKGPRTETLEESLAAFGPRPDTIKDFDFKAEVDHLNFGDMPLSKEQQARLLNMVYYNWEVFFLSDQDLEFCEWSYHTISKLMDKRVHLPHRVVPHQFQGEVCECLDKRLRQRIVRPSNSLYTSKW